MDADSFGGGLDEGFFFRGQAVERAHQPVWRHSFKFDKSGG